jgi:acetyl esterase/lipase
MRGRRMWSVAVVAGFLTAGIVWAQVEPTRQPPAQPGQPQIEEGQEPQRPRARAAEAPRRVEIPAEVEYVRDVIYASAPTEDGPAIDLMLNAAFLKQSDGKPMPAVVFIHGGGYVAGSKEQGDRFIIPFARGGYFAVAINYRLAQQAKFPAAVHDCKAAIRFLRANAEALAIDPDRIGVWGISAGGHLAALLATRGNTDSMDGSIGTSAPGLNAAVACAASMSGPTDFIKLAEKRGSDPLNAKGSDPSFTALRDGLVARWFGRPLDEVRELARQASPMTYIDAKDPPMLLVHGTEDSTVPVSQSQLLHDALKEAGVPVQFEKVEGAEHAIRDLAVYRRLAEFFDQRLGGKAAASVADVGRLLQGGESPVGAERPARPRRPGAPSDPSPAPADPMNPRQPAEPRSPDR